MIQNTELTVAQNLEKIVSRDQGVFYGVTPTSTTAPGIFYFSINYDHYTGAICMCAKPQHSNIGVQGSIDPSMPFDLQEVIRSDDKMGDDYKFGTLPGDAVIQVTLKAYEQLRQEIANRGMM